MATLRELVAQTRALLDQIEGAADAPPAAEAVDYLRLFDQAEILHFKWPDGNIVNVLARAPINPEWRPSMAGYMYGRGTHWVTEPSNGEAVAQPIRSANGWPLVYGIGRDVSGSNVAVGMPRLLWGDQTFPDEAQLLAYARAEVPAGTGGFFGPRPT
jgi:hypothetical protein